MSRTLPRDVARGRRRRSDEGVAVVEFTLVFCFIVLPLMLAIVQYGYLYYSLQTADAATREATRCLAVGVPWNDYAGTNGPVQGVQNRTLSLINRAAVDGYTPMATVTYSGSATAPQINDSVTVEVKFRTLDMGIFPLGGLQGGLIDRSASVPIQNTVSAANAANKNFPTCT